MSKSSTDISGLSYAPYSNRNEYYYVIGKSGTAYPGVRIENASYPLTIPAAQGAVCSCLGNDDKPVGIVFSESGKKSHKIWVDLLDLKILDAIPEDSLVYDPLIKKVENITNTLKDLCSFVVAEESHFEVTALLKTTAGYIPGVNVEFPEWNLGLCAERVALSRAISAGYTDFLGMHIYAPHSEYISPCGACRQVLFELMPDQFLNLHHDEHSQSSHLTAHLLPNGFTSSSLKNT